MHRLPGALGLGLTAHLAPATLERRLPTLVERLTPAGAVWVAWPKKSARRALAQRHGVTDVDLDDAVVRSTALAAGVVDVKVAALDDTWSALKLVRRLADR